MKEENWKMEIEEISNNIYQLKMIHCLGSTIEKIGSDINEMIELAKIESIKIDNEIKIENRHNTR